MNNKKKLVKDSAKENLLNDSIPHALSTINLPTPNIKRLETLEMVNLIPILALSRVILRLFMIG